MNEDRPDQTLPIDEMQELGTGAQIAGILCEAGMVTPEQLQHARRVHGKLPSQYSLTKVLFELGFLSDQQLRQETAGLLCPRR